MPLEIDYVGEGASDDAVARKLIRAADGFPGIAYRRPQSGDGKASLDRRIPGLDAGCGFGGNPVLILRDLDADAPCAGALVSTLLPNRHPRCLLRVCVRSAEAWLLADASAYARHCGIAEAHLPKTPDEVTNLKTLILGWADEGRAKKLRERLLQGRRRDVQDWRTIGQWHSEFAEGQWRPERAAVRSPSLSKALVRLRELTAKTAPAVHEGDAR